MPSSVTTPVTRPSGGSARSRREQPPTARPTSTSTIAFVATEKPGYAVHPRSPERKRRGLRVATIQASREQSGPEHLGEPRDGRGAFMAIDHHPPRPPASFRLLQRFFQVLRTRRPIGVGMQSLTIMRGYRPRRTKIDKECPCVASCSCSPCSSGFRCPYPRPRRCPSIPPAPRVQPYGESRSRLDEQRPIPRGRLRADQGIRLQLCAIAHGLPLLHRGQRLALVPRGCASRRRPGHRLEREVRDPRHARPPPRPGILRQSSSGGDRPLDQRRDPRRLHRPLGDVCPPLQSVPAARLSFNLVNEPSGTAPEN